MSANADEPHGANGNPVLLASMVITISANGDTNGDRTPALVKLEKLVRMVPMMPMVTVVPIPSVPSKLLSPLAPLKRLNSTGYYKYQIAIGVILIE